MLKGLKEKLETRFGKKTSSTLIVVAVVLAASFLPSHFMFTLTDSLRHHLWFSLGPRSGGDYVKYQAVTFPVKSEYVRQGVKETFKKDILCLTKYIRCMPGDTLSFRDTSPERTDTSTKVIPCKAVYCNDELLGFAFEEDSKGKPLPRFSYDGVIPEGKLFVLGEHMRSFDSRYLGLIPVADITARAYPVL